MHCMVYRRRSYSSTSSNTMRDSLCSLCAVLGFPLRNNLRHGAGGNRSGKAGSTLFRNPVDRQIQAEDRTNPPTVCVPYVRTSKMRGDGTGHNSHSPQRSRTFMVGRTCTLRAKLLLAVICACSKEDTLRAGRPGNHRNVRTCGHFNWLAAEQLPFKGHPFPHGSPSCLSAWHLPGRSHRLSSLAFRSDPFQHCFESGYAK
jgi:hypothetical protein